jgi:endo-alpha-1,4-polygalactosaminidase (GH114 family)
VYLGIFTGRPVNPTEESYSGEREELEGLAIAQRDSINQPATAASPLLHIVIANGGHDMEYAGEAVDVIGGLAAQDPTVVGVIGMDESRDTTAQALARLNRIGLPVIATTLSADRMDRNSRLYLQIGAGNQEQARLIADYSKRVLKLDTGPPAACRVSIKTFTLKHSSTI